MPKSKYPSLPSTATDHKMDSQQQKDQEYLEFIKVTRKHQIERDRLKKLELKKNPTIEEYYIDISQLNTVVLDNLVDAPTRDAESSSRHLAREEELIKFYGSKEEFEKIRSMEMHIDDHFKSKCKELKPHYWPVIPINSKPYLNPIRK